MCAASLVQVGLRDEVTRYVQAFDSSLLPPYNQGLSYLKCKHSSFGDSLGNRTEVSS